MRLQTPIALCKGTRQAFHIADYFLQKKKNFERSRDIMFTISYLSGRGVYPLSPMCALASAVLANIAHAMTRHIRDNAQTPLASTADASTHIGDTGQTPRSDRYEIVNISLVAVCGARLYLDNNVEECRPLPQNGKSVVSFPVFKESFEKSLRGQIDKLHRDLSFLRSQEYTVIRA